MHGRSFYETFPATAFLLLFTVAFFALELIAHRRITGEMPGIMEPLAWEATRALGSVSLRGVFSDGEVWRIVTTIFLHGHYLHIFFSLYILYDVGRLCEPLLSSWKFLFVYLAAGVGASMTSLGWNWLSGVDRPSVGASGALSGLIGLLLVHSLLERKQELRNHLLSWIGWIVLFSFIAPNIDHAAHAGGFVVGALLGLTARDYMTSQAAARWRLPGYLTLAALLASLGCGIWNYFRAV